MSIEAKRLAGQRILAGFHGLNVPEELKTLVREHLVNNFILFKRNVQSREQLAALCTELQALAMEATGQPALIAIDQEGGTVSRLSADCANVPTAMALAATGDPQNAYQAGVITGRELSAMGVNFNLAPVMDINSNPANPVIGARSYGDTPETVCAYGTEAIRGLRDGGVLTCAKHFPGHGDTAVDSHLGLPRVEKTLDELLSCELIPFRAAIEAGVSAVMTTHILFPKLDDSGVPGTMSPAIIRGLLREKLGYDGLVVSDCLMMDAIARFYGTVEGALAACDAGVDLVCISHDPALAGQACEAIARRGNMEEARRSAERIRRVRQELAALPPRPALSVVGSPEHRAQNRRMREASVSAVGAPLPALGESPFFVGCSPFVTSEIMSPTQRDICFPEWMHRRFGGACLVTDINPGAEEIARAVEGARGASCVALCTFNAHMKPGQLVLLRELARLHLPMIACALRDPYDLTHLPAGVSGLLTYEYSEDTLSVLEDVFSGALLPAGRCPCAL